MQGAWLEALGFGPEEAAHEVIASGALWRLRRYRGGDSGPTVLLVPAPIKHPYIWDLAPSVSAVRRCLDEGFRVYLLEWRPPGAGSEAGGVAAYAEEAISAAVATLAEAAGPAKPVLVGHSLGGTLAAIQGGLHPDRFAGLVLLSAPLCFQQGASGFGDALADVASPWLSDSDVIPGSLLTQLSAAASPATFLWSRVTDAAATAGDPRATQIRMRIERWSLDEVPLSGRLAREVLSWLYGDNRLCSGTLEVGGKRIDPARLGLPILAVTNTADDVAPPQSVRPFLEAMPGADCRQIEYPGEAGIVLQHLGALVGREAFARLWPEIIAWIRERSG
jgi:polyhydroxyalkanoate synthase